MAREAGVPDDLLDVGLVRSAFSIDTAIAAKLPWIKRYEAPHRAPNRGLRLCSARLQRRTSDRPMWALA